MRQTATLALGKQDAMTTTVRHRRSVAVLASTLLASVAVAVSPSQSVAAAQIPLPTSELASPAIESLSVGRQDILSRSSTGALTQQYILPGGSWRRPLNRGGGLASQPVTVSWAPNRLDAFARGNDNALWHRYLTNGAWSPWTSLGGTLTSAPAVASWGPGRLDVFVRSTNNVMYQKTFVNGSGWSGWASRGGILSSSPAATSGEPGRIDVVVRGANNRAYHRTFQSGSWSPWRGLGGTLTSQPAVASPAPGQLDVAVLGSTNRISLKRLTSAGWSAWSAVGTATHASGPSMTAIGDDVVIATKRSNGFFYRSTRSSVGASWSGWQAVDHFLAFRGLATWVDTFDYAALTPSTAIADMKARGVRTLFLATGRFNSPSDFFDEAKMGDWLDRAHAEGIRVIGWYVPAYGNMARDVRRTVAINDYASPGGQRFDALGVDIERLDEVSRATFNARVVPHLQQSRAQTSLPFGAIVPTPFTTNAGNNWAGFPWSGIGPNSEVVVPMTLWTFRTNLTVAGVSTYVRNEVDRTQALTGRRVHVEGGVLGEPKSGGTPFTTGRLQAFVDASKAAGVIGGSNYDYATFTPRTPTEKNTWWAVLRGFNTL